MDFEIGKVKIAQLTKDYLGYKAGDTIVFDVDMLGLIYAPDDVNVGYFIGTGPNKITKGDVENVQTLDFSTDSLSTLVFLTMKNVKISVELFTKLAM